MAIASFDIDGMPGQFSPAFNSSNKPKLDLSAAFLPAISRMPLRRGATADGLPASYQDSSWFALDILMLLVSNPAVIVSKAEIIAKVWPETFWWRRT